MGQLRSYLLALTAAAFLVSLAQALPIKGAARRMVRLACGLFLCLVLLGPLLRLRFGDLRAYLDRFSLPEAGSEAVEAENQRLAGQIIKEQTETYILDKAGELGAEVTVEVGLRALSPHYSYPDTVTVTGLLTAAQRAELSAYISDFLDIPGERQTWIATTP